MAFATETRSATSDLALDLSASIYALMTRIADYRAYRRTVAELSDLNTRELTDLGLNRASIHAAAYEAVYGAGA